MSKVREDGLYCIKNEEERKPMTSISGNTRCILIKKEHSSNPPSFTSRQVSISFNDCKAVHYEALSSGIEQNSLISEVRTLLKNPPIFENNKAVYFNERINSTNSKYRFKFSSID